MVRWLFQVKVAESEVEWNATYTEIYVAEYDSIYRGHIDKEDEDPFIRSGKFILT